ncbi:hypothetical protein HMPREF9709_01197 [Helcococcus kunzii ATCC 51366]|uniref:Phage minor capsid protein 2 n=1 Tax=Helcococcus kunzii ATCC 51366 TaxID=883114 RepID=H3NPD6_9FIRM|nr:phage minor capsid protein [Helcococcus kunzii]EHR33449.1 hypothetical protein HMPREF9709_01197 [Helcococcus kunzii ATCC 51366]
MLNHKELINLSKELSYQFNELERMLIWDIARRIDSEINGKGNYTQTAEKQMQDLIDIGYDSKRAREMIANTLGISASVVDSIVYKYGFEKYRDDFKHYATVGKKLQDFERNGFVVNLIRATQEDLKKGILNLSGTIGFVDEKGKFSQVDNYYRQAINTAVFQTTSGAFDYQSVTRRIVKQMAKSGVRTVNYESGVSRSLESTVRNNLLTGISQMAGKIALQNAIDMGEDLMEITAHAGARPSHSVWQGQIVSLSGRSGYLNLIDIGYGDVAGFQGANCYHDWFVFFEGISTRNYTQSQLDEFNDQSKKYEFNGKEYSEYEAGQKMRQIERSISQTKRELVGLDATDDKEMFTARSIYLKRQRELYDEFSEVTGKEKLPLNQLVYNFDRKKAVQATWAYKKVDKLAEKLYNIYNKNERINLLARHNLFNEKWNKSEFRTEKSLQGHFKSHGKEFNFKTKEEYIKSARKLLSKKIDGENIFGYETKDGRTVIYDKAKNEIAIGQNGYIKTFYKPTKQYDYYLEQLEKDVKNGK